MKHLSVLPLRFRRRIPSHIHWWNMLISSDNIGHLPNSLAQSLFLIRYAPLILFSLWIQRWLLLVRWLVCWYALHYARVVILGVLRWRCWAEAFHFGRGGLLLRVTFLCSWWRWSILGSILTAWSHNLRQWSVSIDVVGVIETGLHDWLGTIWPRMRHSSIVYLTSRYWLLIPRVSRVSCYIVIRLINSILSCSHRPSSERIKFIIPILDA